jgi:non-ribosomal peptide synthase protein (TIGR01720 family)
VRWSYSGEIHRAETVERLAELYLTILRELIAHCLSPQAGGVSVADFPLAQLAGEELDGVLSEVDFEERTA